MRQLIEDLISAMEYHVEQTRPIHSTTVALQAARDALKSLPAQQEPVAICEYCEKERPVIQAEGKPWVGLTDEDDVVGMARDAFAARYCALPVAESRIKAFAEMLDAKLEEKNT